MILLFGPKANKSKAAESPKSIKTHPVENSGILAINFSNAKSLLTMGEYDTYISSNPVAIDFSMYANYESITNESSGFMSEFSTAVALLGDCGFSEGSFSDCGSCSGAFSSVG